MRRAFACTDRISHTSNRQNIAALVYSPKYLLFIKGHLNVSNAIFSPAPSPSHLHGFFSDSIQNEALFAQELVFIKFNWKSAVKMHINHIDVKEGVEK